MLTLFYFISIMSGFSQEEQQLGVLESDSTWVKEIIKFPIGFAPEIKYTGYEDLRFAKQWRNQDSEDFWCYMFVWHVDGIQNPTVDSLEKDVQFYYDGIMKAVNKKKDFIVPKTKVGFTKSNNTAIDFVGKIDVYDSFNVEKMITLNVQVKTYYCDTNNTTNIMFKLSPQSFDKDIWTRFNEIKIKTGICNN